MYAIARKSSVPHPYSSSYLTRVTLSLIQRTTTRRYGQGYSERHSLILKDIRKSNIQNEYGVAETSRLALPRRNDVLFVATFLRSYIKSIRTIDKIFS